MKIRFLGHAGFRVRSKKGDYLLMDPWLSNKGAYYQGWFQWPRNHHILQELEDGIRKTYDWYLENVSQ